MDTLKGFRDKDFLEQVTVLSVIEKEKTFDAVPELFALHANPLGDASVDLMVTNALKALLLANSDMTMEGLVHEHPAVRELSLHVLMQNPSSQATEILMDAAKAEKNLEMRFEILSALSKLEDPATLPVFRECLTMDDPWFLGLGLGVVADMADVESLPVVTEMVIRAEDDDRYEVCELSTYEAIRVIQAIATPEAVTFLASKIHHRNPTARRLIHEALIAIGSAATETISALFEHDDVDERILAANILGEIRDKHGADVMIEALDDNRAEHPNIRFAIYEALGKIPYIKGLVHLVDGLGEEDEMILIAVVTSLDGSLNPGIVNRIREFATKPGHGERVCSAIASAGSLNIFGALYKAGGLEKQLFAKVQALGDPELKKAFRERLLTLDAPHAQEHAAQLMDSDTEKATGRILTVDDSKAMLLFYRGAIPALGFEVMTADNGLRAHEVLKSDTDFRLLVVDMNMPEMDGIELTRKVREIDEMKQVPIIMATTESEGSQIDLAKKAGVSAFISKPFKPETLHGKIRELLGTV
ncbi:HEAT repeat domain-containing protein [Desulfovibrio inopinatus]|uniref:HEAT repeat domain-containing protein n=1 Tax=Desulfovibrio inopinatus TaxID=102109 RepID=UPI00042609E7|nr:HEAT repeat domain-containing protein [Desulfovibrio inopinatus]